MVLKAKRYLYVNPNARNITDDKQFWKTVSPFFPAKLVAMKKINLEQEDK